MLCISYFVIGMCISINIVIQFNHTRTVNRTIIFELRGNQLGLSVSVIVSIFEYSKGLNYLGITYKIKQLQLFIEFAYIQCLNRLLDIYGGDNYSLFW